MAEDKKKESVKKEKKAPSNKTKKVSSNERIADVLKKAEVINENKENKRTSTTTKTATTKTTKTSSVRKNNTKENSVKNTKTTSTKKTTSKKAPSSKKINKQAKKEDEKIKQILAEQLANIETIEEISEKKANNISQELNTKIEKKRKKYNPEEIAKKIENKKKLPKEEKGKLYKKIIINIVVAWAIVTYFIFVNLGCLHIQGEVFITDLKVFSLTLIAIAIIIFESAYNKDNGSIAIFGIETLVAAIVTLVSIYMYILHQEIYVMYIAIASFVSIIYYILKSIIIGIHAKREYKKTISDVKEIIEED